MEKEELNNLEFEKLTRADKDNSVVSFFYKNTENGKKLRVDMTYREEYSYPNGGNPYDAEIKDVLTEISVYEESLARKILNKKEKCLYHASGAELKSEFAKEIFKQTGKDKEKALKLESKSKPKSAKQEAFEAYMRKQWEDYLNH